MFNLSIDRVQHYPYLSENNHSDYNNSLKDDDFTGIINYIFPFFMILELAVVKRPLLINLVGSMAL